MKAAQKYNFYCYHIIHESTLRVLFFLLMRYSGEDRSTAKWIIIVTA